MNARIATTTAAVLLLAGGLVSAGPQPMEPAGAGESGPLPVVPGLNADFLDGHGAEDFALAGHDHDGRYLPLDGTAANAVRLDGHEAAAFAVAGHDHDDRYLTPAQAEARFLAKDSEGINADLLDGLDSTQFLRSDVPGTLAGSLRVDGMLGVGKDPGAGVDVLAPQGQVSVRFGDGLGAGYLHAGGDDVFLGTDDGSKVIHVDQGSKNVGIGATPPTDQLRPQATLDVRGSFILGEGGVALLRMGKQVITWDPPEVAREDCITARLGPLEGVVIGMDPPAMAYDPAYPSSAYNWNYQWTDFGASGGGITSRSGGQGNPGTWITVEFCQWLNEVGSYDPPAAEWKVYYVVE